MNWKRKVESLERRIMHVMNLMINYKMGFLQRKKEENVRGYSIAYSQQIVIWNCIKSSMKMMIIMMPTFIFTHHLLLFASWCWWCPFIRNYTQPRHCFNSFCLLLPSSLSQAFTFLLQTICSLRSPSPSPPACLFLPSIAHLIIIL